MTADYRAAADAEIARAVSDLTDRAVNAEAKLHTIKRRLDLLENQLEQIGDVDPTITGPATVRLNRVAVETNYRYAAALADIARVLS